VVAACARLRRAVEAAGQARAACYAAVGKPVPPEVAPPEVHITGLPREQATRHAEKTLVSVRAERIAVATAADRLPRGCRRPAERMTRVWDTLVWDRFYIHADLHLGLAEINTPPGHSSKPCRPAGARSAGRHASEHAITNGAASGPATVGPEHQNRRLIRPLVNQAPVPAPRSPGQHRQGIAY
jgi:hypothetical protein